MTLRALRTGWLIHHHVFYFFSSTLSFVSLYYLDDSRWISSVEFCLIVFLKWKEGVLFLGQRKRRRCGPLREAVFLSDRVFVCLSSIPF